MTDTIKYFTLAEANNALPFVKKVVSDILGSYTEWENRVRNYELLVGSDGSITEPEGHIEARESVEEIARDISAYIQELVQVGCVLKGFDNGLVDFYSKMDGRDVLLCWKFGEDAVANWHEIDGGFAGRQPITPELAQRC
jgi:hypothetical protein